MRGILVRWLISTALNVACVVPIMMMITRPAQAPPQPVRQVGESSPPAAESGEKAPSEVTPEEIAARPITMPGGKNEFPVAPRLTESPRPAGPVVAPAIYVTREPLVAQPGFPQPPPPPVTFKVKPPTASQISRSASPEPKLKAIPQGFYRRGLFGRRVWVSYR